VGGETLVKTVSRETNAEPIRMTLTKDGVPCAMSFTRISSSYFVSDCKRYALCITHGEGHVAGFKPYGAFIRPLHNTKDKDGNYPAAENIGFFEHMKGRDSAIAACIRHKRAQPIDNTTTPQTAASQELTA
jgi:hypothetical protein